MKLYGLACAGMGAMGFWSLLLYRVGTEGLQWLFKTSDGIIIFGLIGICGWLLLSVGEVLEILKREKR